MEPGLHHISKRKRIHEKHEQYPHPQTHKAFVDKIVIILAGL